MSCMSRIAWENKPALPALVLLPRQGQHTFFQVGGTLKTRSEPHSRLQMGVFTGEWEKFREES